MVTGDTCGLLPPITFDLASSVTWLPQLAFHAVATWTKVAAVDPVAGQFTVKPVVTMNRINSITRNFLWHRTARTARAKISYGPHSVSLS
jgi:hypothetical protein